MSDQPDGKDQVWYSEQVVQMLVADIRAALESQLTPEEVSQAFQETSLKLGERLEPPQTSLPESAHDQILALIIEMRMW